jgi:hypothetical protein
MSRIKFVLLLLASTVILASIAGVIQRLLAPQARADWAALLLSAASLSLSALTFYLMEVRGPDITITQQLEIGARYSANRSVWIKDGSFKAVVECRLLIANQGRRPGILETFTLGAPSFSPQNPKLLTAHAIRPHGEDGNEIRPPIILRDGAMLSAVVAVELSPGDKNGDFVQRSAHDLRELHSVVLPFRYAYASRGVVLRKYGSASLPLAAVRDAAHTNWREMPDAQAGYRILETTA